MSMFEIRANNYVTAIGAAAHRIEHYGYDDEPPEEVLARIYGSFVIWLTAQEEARAQQRLGLASASFSTHVIAQVPVQDDPTWPAYIGRSNNDPPISSLYDRTCALWGVRVAYAHGDGDTDRVSNKTNKGYALDAVNHLPGVKMDGSRLVVTGQITHVAIRTMVQLRDLLV